MDDNIREYIKMYYDFQHNRHCVGLEPTPEDIDALENARNSCFDPSHILPRYELLACTTDPRRCYFENPQVNEGFVGRAGAEIKVRGGEMRVRTYAVLERAVEDGVAAGMRHFFKHRDPPRGFAAIETELRDKIADDVMLAITEWFDFPEHDDA